MYTSWRPKFLWTLPHSRRSARATTRMPIRIRGIPKATARTTPIREGSLQQDKGPDKILRISQKDAQILAAWSRKDRAQRSEVAAEESEQINELIRKVLQEGSRTQRQRAFQDHRKSSPAPMMRPKIGGSLIGEEAQILEDIRRAASMAETRRINRYVKSKEAMKNASRSMKGEFTKLRDSLRSSGLSVLANLDARIEALHMSRNAAETEESPRVSAHDDSGDGSGALDSDDDGAGEIRPSRRNAVFNDDGSIAHSLELDELDERTQENVEGRELVIKSTECTIAEVEDDAVTFSMNDHIMLVDKYSLLAAEYDTLKEANAILKSKLSRVKAANCKKK